MSLTTRYLGLELRNPIVASASPLSQDVAGVSALAAAGVGAVVLPSLMEEVVRQREVDDFLEVARHEDAFGEATSYFPEPLLDEVDGVGQYLTLVREAVAAVDVPVIASLNGASLGGWTSIASQLAAAGAAAIELNIYAVPGDLTTSGAEIEARHVEILRRVRAAVAVPVAVKLSPYFSNTGHVARDLVAAGADGLVLFNRFLQPDIDPVTMSVEPGVYLSRPEDGRLPRAWIAVLRNEIGSASLAATGGAWSAGEVAKGSWPGRMPSWSRRLCSSTVSALWEMVEV